MAFFSDVSGVLGLSGAAVAALCHVALNDYRRDDSTHLYDCFCSRSYLYVSQSFICIMTLILCCCAGNDLVSLSLCAGERRWRITGGLRRSQPEAGARPRDH